MIFFQLVLDLKFENFINKKLEKMGGCCQILRSKEIPEISEVDINSFIKNTNNNIYQNKIEKIQSYYRGMKFRQKFYKQQSELTNSSSKKFNKIPKEEFEEVLKKYPKLNSNNNNNIQIVKNILLDNKELYYGEYSEKNMKEGRGILVTKNSSKYYGYFKNNKKNIRGKLVHYEGDIYEGEWLDDKANGKGKYTHIDCTTYDGVWKNDKQNGYDVETWNDVSYYMVFINGLMVHLMKGILKKILLMEKENIYGKIKENMREIG